MNFLFGKIIDKETGEEYPLHVFKINKNKAEDNYIGSWAEIDEYDDCLINICSAPEPNPKHGYKMLGCSWTNIKKGDWKWESNIT